MRILLIKDHGEHSLTDIMYIEMKKNETEDQAMIRHMKDSCDVEELSDKMTANDWADSYSWHEIEVI